MNQILIWGHSVDQIKDNFARKTSLSPPVIHYRQFQGGGSGVVSVSCFGVKSFGDVSLYVCSLYF